MHNLFAVYDLTNYYAYSAIGIALSFAAAGIILVFTVVAYRKALARERAASPPDTAGIAAPPPTGVTQEAAATADEAHIKEETPPAAVTAATAGGTETEDMPPAAAAKQTVAAAGKTEVKEATPPAAAAEEAAATVATDIGEAATAAGGAAEDVCDGGAPAAAENGAVYASAADPEIGGSGNAETPARPAETPARGRLPDFLAALTSAMTTEARAAFTYAVVENAADLATKVRPLAEYADEETFLRDFFRCSGKYKNILPTSAYEVLYDRYVPYVGKDAARTRLNNKLIGACYARRKLEEDALAKCERLCREDVAFNLEKRKLSETRLPALKRLILICAARGDFAEAMALCDRAIGRGLIDRKGEGYEARREKLAARYEKLKRREERARAKTEKAERKAAAESASDKHTEVAQ